MRSWFIRLSTLVLLCLSSAGCIVQSFFSFYQSGQTQSVNSFQGDWSVVEDMGEKVDPAKPRMWSIKDNMITAVDKDGRQARFELTVFTVDGHMYADVFPGSDNGINQYLAFHFSPVHTLCRLSQGDGKLTLTPMDYEWLQDLIEKRIAQLPMIKEPQSGMVLYTASPAEWQHFLKAFGRNPKAFNINNQIVLKRVGAAAHASIPAIR